MDTSTREVVVPGKLGIGVDDVTINAGAEAPIVEAAFWNIPLLREPLCRSLLVFTEKAPDGDPGPDVSL